MDARDGSTVDTLAAKVDELGRICARLSRENAELRGRVSRLMAGGAIAGGDTVGGVRSGGANAAARRDPAGPAHSRSGQAGAHDGREDGPAGGTVSRRVLGKALGAAAAGMVGAAALTDLGAQPAAASDGANVTAGHVTTCENPTEVLYDGPSGLSGAVLVGNDSAYNPVSLEFPAALAGLAGAGSTAGSGGVSSGVFGLTDNGRGYGVVGHNSGLVGADGTGAGVRGDASSANVIGVMGTNSAGTAISGSSGSSAANATAIVGTLDNNGPGSFSAGVRGLNLGTGSNGIGVWGSHGGSGWGVYGTVSGAGNGVRGEVSSAAAVGVLGHNGAGTAVEGLSGSTAANATAILGTMTSTSPGALCAAVKGQNNGTGGNGVGVWGSHAGSGWAVYGTVTGAGIGVLGQGLSTGTGVRGDSVKGRGGVFNGAAAQVQLLPGTNSTHPKSGQQGDLYSDKTGRLWFCKKGGATATWAQIA